MLILGVLYLLLSLLVSRASAQPCSTAANAVISAPCDLAPGTHTYTSFTVQAGGIVNIQYSTGSTLGVTLSAQTVDVQTTGIIRGTAQGWPQNSGPGGAVNTGTSDPGADAASHGGAGGDSAPGGWKAPYGDFRQPITAGSGGGGTSYGAGGAGGSAIKIEATTSLTVDGTVEVDGGSTGSLTRDPGAGAGGSIWIVTPTLSGTGVLSANGGNAGSSGASGGGGRISVEASASLPFTGTMRAFGGSGRYTGSAGTILKTVAGQTELFIDGNNVSPAPVRHAYVLSPGTETFSFDSVNCVRGGRVLFADSGDILSITEAQMTGDNTGQICTAGAIDAATVGTVTGVGFCNLAGSTITFSAAVINLINARTTFQGIVAGATGWSVTNGGRLQLYAVGQTSGAVPGEYAWSSVAASGASSAVEFYGDTATPRGVTLTLTTASIASGSLFNGNGRGFPISQGPGGTPYSGTSHASGPGHGGVGGSGSVRRAVGGAYGSTLSPVTMGSGGSSSAYAPGGAGGSAIRLVVSGLLTVDGELVVNGNDGGGPVTRDPSGGSGGSIWVTCGTLAGAGQIRANGGQSRGGGGGPAGGRIALEYGAKSFTGAISAFGGGGFDEGAAGTIYEADTTSSTSSLTIDNNNQVAGDRTQIIPYAVVSDVAVTTYTFDTIEVVREGYVHFTDPGDVLVVDTNDLVGDGTGRVCSSGLIDASTLSVLNDVGLCSLASGELRLADTVEIDNLKMRVEGGLSGARTSVTLRGSATFDLFATGSTVGDGPGIFDFTTASAWNVESGSRVQCSADLSANTGPDVRLGSVSVATGGAISTRSTRVAYGGNGQGSGASSASGTSHAAGAGHAGQGGASTNRGASPYYGDFDAPVAPGSSSGSTSYISGATGGGACHITASQGFNLDGTFLANGGNGGDATRDTGGGSGGSIWITAATLSGAGTISANGGNGGSSSGGGAGGRIAIYADSSQFTGLVSALPGTAGYRNAAAGTIYYNNPATGFDRLVVDNNNVALFYPSVIAESNPVETYSFSEIALTKGARVTMPDTSDTLYVDDGTTFTGDDTGQLCSSGIIDGRSLWSLSEVSLCGLAGGTLILAPELDLYGGIHVRVDGDLTGGHVFRLHDSTKMYLRATGRTATQATGTFELCGVELLASSELVLEPNSAGPTGVTLNVGNFLVTTGARVSGGTGFASMSGPGAPAAGLAGAGHAGAGADENANAGGSTYGSATNPRTLGSGGSGAAGGGVVYITAQNVSISGQISVAGADASSGGGGSGGSIFVHADRWLSTGGEFYATGGNGAAGGGGGGGGYIRLITAEATAPTTALNDASGGSGGTTVAGAGSISVAGSVPVTAWDFVCAGVYTTAQPTRTTGATTTTTTTITATATATASAAATSSSSNSGAATTSEASSEEGLDLLLYIGVAVVGLLLCICLAVFCGLCLVRRNRSKQQNDVEEIQLKTHETVGLPTPEYSPIEATSNTEYSPMGSRGTSPVALDSPVREYQPLDSGGSTPTSRTSFNQGDRDVARFHIKYSDLDMGEVIGEGSYGQVHRGKWRNGEVAIKKLSKKLSELTQDEQDDFLAEASMLSSLRPFTNVVQFLGVTTSQTDPTCLVTEFLSGGSLYSALRAPGADLVFTEAIEMKIATGIAAGMAHLAVEKIVHRDLAARNILLTSDYTPKVCDFGYSRMLVSEDDGGKTNSAVGPLRWMAPESLVDREYSEKSDVWSFGLVLVEIATGDIPYPELDPVQVSSKVSMGVLAASLPDSAPAAFHSVFSLCMERDPKSRVGFGQVCKVLG